MTIPATLAPFTQVRNTDPNTRLGPIANNQLQADGEQNNVNLFTRAWDFFNRTPEQVEANKQVAREFVRGIQDAYGKEVAGMASRELSDHLKSGRPLTTHRVDRILEKSQEMVRSIQAGNREVLARSLEQLHARAVKDAFDAPIHDHVLTRKEQYHAIAAAIQRDPAFRSVSFNTAMHEVAEDFFDMDWLRALDQPFVSKYQTLAREALTHAALVKVTPGAVDVVRQHTAQTSPVTQNDQAFWLGKLRLDVQTDSALQIQSAAVRHIAVTLMSGETPVRVALGQIAQLRASASAPADELGIRHLKLAGPAADYRDALLDDMDRLARQIGARVGLNELPIQQAHGLLDAALRCAELDEAITNGDTGYLDTATDMVNELNAEVIRLENADASGQAGRDLAKQVASEAKSMVAALTDFLTLQAQGQPPKQALAQVRQNLGMADI